MPRLAKANTRMTCGRSGPAGRYKSLARNGRRITRNGSQRMLVRKHNRSRRLHMFGNFRDHLEKQLADIRAADTILYSSCFDANGGLFETLLGAEDAVISDELNHASIIDGVRLCKAQRFRYANNDMADLESKLREAAEKGARFKLIATDGVFSM